MNQSKTVERLRAKLEKRKAQELFDKEFNPENVSADEIDKRINQVIKNLRDDMDDDTIINLFKDGKIDPWKLTQEQQDKVYKALPKEQQAAIDRYRKMFEKFYSEDISKPKDYVENEGQLIDIMAQLKSGLSIDDLSNDEKIFLAEHYGFDWEKIINKKLGEYLDQF